MTEDMRVGEETVYFWSHTRTLTGSAELSKLPPPDVAAATARLPNITFTPPVPATQDELNAAIAKLQTDLDPAAARIESIAVKPKKSDIQITQMGLLWMA